MKGEEKRKVRLLYAGDRMVNFRPVLFLCMAFGLGIFLFSVLGLYALFFCAAAGIAAVVLLVLKRLKARRIRGMLLFSLLVAAVFAAGVLSLFGHFASFTAAPEIEGDCTVVGTVEEIGAAGSGQVFTLRAVRIAQASDVVAAKGGLDGEIAQEGRNLSGGQRQRLTIARALVRMPELLILDDSSSALDYATDARLRAALKELECTIVIVSQRIASVRHADKIVVLDEGNVAGIGSHEELLRTCRVYREISASQEREAQA